jgi:hypothetical protein
MGTPGFGTPDGSVAITGASPAFTGSLTSTLLPGSYYYQVAATGSGTVFNSLVAVATVPELGTWAMVGIGFAALGYVGFAKRKRLVLEDFA